MWRGGVRSSMRVAAPSSGGALVARPLRFHIPLIEPDMQISRIRLSDKISRLHPRRAAAKLGQTYEPEVPVETREWISPASASPDLVFGPQPPTQLHRRIVVERAIRFTVKDPPECRTMPIPRLTPRHHPRSSAHGNCSQCRGAFRTAALLSLGASQPGGLRKGELFVLRAAGVEPGRSGLLFGTVRTRPSSRPQPWLRAPRRVMWLRGTRVRVPSRMR